MVEMFGGLLVLLGSLTVFYGLMASISLPDDDLMTF